MKNYAPLIKSIIDIPTKILGPLILKLIAPSWMNTFRFVYNFCLRPFLCVEHAGLIQHTVQMEIRFYQYLYGYMTVTQINLLEAKYITNWLTNKPANCMDQRPPWETQRPSVSQEIPHILWNRNILNNIHKRSSPVPVLNQINQIHASSSHFLCIHFNVILPSASIIFCI